MELTEGLGSRIIDLKQLRRKLFNINHATTEVGCRNAIEDKFERALLNWQIDCLERDCLIRFDFETYNK